MLFHSFKAQHKLMKTTDMGTSNESSSYQGQADKDITFNLDLWKRNKGQLWRTGIQKHRNGVYTHQAFLSSLSASLGCVVSNFLAKSCSDLLPFKCQLRCFRVWLACSGRFWKQKGLSFQRQDIFSSEKRLYSVKNTLLEQLGNEK